jgi:hypothetical protein
MGSDQTDASKRSRPFRLGRVFLDWEELNDDWEVRYGVEDPESSSVSSLSLLSSASVDNVLDGGMGVVLLLQLCSCS